MRVIHYYPKDNSMVCQHVDTLCNAMGLEVDSYKAHSAADVSKIIGTNGYWLFDILHIHGLWQVALKEVVSMSLQRKARIVITPHGDLHPWGEGRKLANRLKYYTTTRGILKQTYALIAQLPAERMRLESLGAGQRVVTIRDCTSTNVISPVEMARQTFAVYQRVADSNPLQLMDDSERKALRAIIMMGITGDKRWLGAGGGQEQLQVTRRLMCYFRQEEIMETALKGIRLLRLDEPDIDIENVPYFLPDNYKHADTIQAIIGNQFASENDRLTATFRQVKRIDSQRQLSIKHLIEIDRELRNHESEENKLQDSLKDLDLYKTAARTMFLLQQRTGLTEGFMPIKMLNDRKARKMLGRIDNHLKI